MQNIFAVLLFSLHYVYIFFIFFTDLWILGMDYLRKKKGKTYFSVVFTEKKKKSYLNFIGLINLTFINSSFTFFSFLIIYFSNSSHEGDVTVDFSGDSVDLQVVPPVSSHYEVKIMPGKRTWPNASFENSFCITIKLILIDAHARAMLFKYTANWTLHYHLCYRLCTLTISVYLTILAALCQTYLNWVRKQYLTMTLYFPS